MKNVPYLTASAKHAYGQTQCLNLRPLTKINYNSLKMYNNCLSTKSGVTVID